MPQIKRLYLPRYVQYFHIWPSALCSLTTFSVDYIYDYQAYHILHLTSNSLQEFVTQRLISDEHSDREEHRTLILPILRNLVLKRPINNNASLKKTPLKNHYSLNQRTVYWITRLRSYTDSIHAWLLVELVEKPPATIHYLFSKLTGRLQIVSQLHFESWITLGITFQRWPTGVQSTCGFPRPRCTQKFKWRTFASAWNLYNYCQSLQEMLVYRFSGVPTICVRLKTVHIKTCTCCRKGMDLLRTALANSKSEITIATVMLRSSQFFPPVYNWANLACRRALGLSFGWRVLNTRTVIEFSWTQLIRTKKKNLNHEQPSSKVNGKFIITRSGHLSEPERRLCVEEHINIPPSATKKNISASEHVHLAK